MDTACIQTFKKRKLGLTPVASTTMTTTTSINDLKDDEIIEILVRLPLEYVFCCKCVSKHWLALISDSSFVRSYIQRRPSHEICDQFILFHVYSIDDSASGLYGHIPMPSIVYPSSSTNTNTDRYEISDPSGKFFDFSFKFFPFEVKKRFRSFGIVRNSHGLLLCKGELIRPRSSTYGLFCDVEYYVCNPLTRQWLKISRHPYECRVSLNIGYVGFMCYALDSHLPHKVHFTVLEVDKKPREVEYFYTRIFSSETGCWTMYRVSCPSGPSWLSGPSRGTYDTHFDDHTYDFGTIVVYRGKFHWNGGSCLIAYDPLNQPNKCVLMPTPKELAYNGSRIELSEGYIRLNTYSENNVSHKGKYLVYQLTDYDIGKWDLKFIVHDPFPNMLTSFGSQTNGEIIFVRYFRGKTKKYLLFNMRSKSILGYVDIPEHSIIVSYTADSFVMTPWPTIIPQLPPYQKR